MDLSGKRVAVVGLARSGLAAIELLVSRGARVVATDVKPLSALPDAAAVLERHSVPFALQSPEVFREVELVVLSPGVPPHSVVLEEARQRGVWVIGEVELAAWFLQGPVIGITGTNGKTTTTVLTGHLLASAGIPAQVGGNTGMGFPAASALVATSRPEQWNVLEVSSFQLETIEHFRAAIAVGLNVTPDHLDRHGTFEAYAAAKARLFETQTEDGYAVLNADDPVCVRYAARTPARAVWFSLTRPVAPGLWLDGGRIRFDDELLVEVNAIPLRGRHNLENVMAASAAARLAGVDLRTIAAALQTFRGVEHRLEFVRRAAGIEFYNDSKATNVDAAIKAIEAFAGRLWVILGGEDKKGSDFRPLAAALAGKARGALLIGEAAPRLAAALEGRVPYWECGTLAAAVEQAWQRAAPGDTVLLAPACASFDQFENYEHRGRVFKELVGRLHEASRGKGRRAEEAWPNG
ncbi:MAG: UDP-N-acetylmuramoyl-L-alanine--D-glutamate ligase [Bryobacterales bacterium]|nr:UDP-N-acetylmuramoyl-L-alanine--D-glutamate ligase [Bryobacteraceae bacterium]MDW8356027.1 UDP-N-acetylmuramoyl-L-alanine--D-glutamate ligase [Bryobacterales bacterium]